MAEEQRPEQIEWIAVDQVGAPAWVWAQLADDIGIDQAVALTSEPNELRRALLGAQMKALAN